MRSHLFRATVFFAALVYHPRASEAQSAASNQPALPPLPASDSIFRRARRLVSDGNGAAGRALVDSMVRSSAEGTPTYGDAIFWRGALAETAAEAERDYRRVIVEYPLSPYADDALLSLAELEQARGDRTAAYQHLQRFVREHPASPARARAGLAAARLAFEQRDLTHGCAMIADARASVGASDVELRNQIDYYGGRCLTTASAQEAGPTAVASGSPATAPVAQPVVETTKSATPNAVASKSGGNKPATKPVTTKPATRQPVASSSLAAKTGSSAPMRDTSASSKSAAPSSATPRSSATTEGATSTRAPSAASTPRGTWTIQLAAYNTRPDAERLVKKLTSRGVTARISGESKPFRVRLDYYATRQAAAEAVAALKQRGIVGFVTEEARPGTGSSP